MTQKVKVGIGVGIGIAVLIAAFTTVLNKRWWIKRIEAKWVTSRWEWVPALQHWELVKDGYNTGNLGKYSLAQLAKDYAVGVQGWTKPGDPDPVMPATPSAVGEGQFLAGE